MITVLSCVAYAHDIELVVLAGLLCIFGSWVASRLFRRAQDRQGLQRLVWCSLAACTAGVTIWCTHFVAMLGFKSGVPVSFDVVGTFASLLIAILGSTGGFLIAGGKWTRFAPALGGAFLGLAIAAMHYAGMIAYRVQGVVDWDMGYLAASIVLAVILSSVALLVGSRNGKRDGEKMAALLSAAILSLHFTGMTAFAVEPVAIEAIHTNPEAFKMLALAIAGPAILIVMGGLVSYAIDDHARLESIEELTKARDEAERASNAKSEFISILSHELRTPLTIALGYAQILSNIKSTQLAKLPEEESELHPREAALCDLTEQYGKKIVHSGDHLLNLINEILDFTSLEHGDQKLSKTDFSLRDLLVEVKDNFARLSEETNISITVDCAEFLVRADRGRCSQILINLVGNALKFSGGSVIRLKGDVQRDGFAISVEDDGRGIAGEHMDAIFEAFQQIESPDHRSAGGTGLGLAICKKLAIAHGGDITVDSEVGAGAGFTVVIPSPIRPSEAEEPPRAA